MKTIAAYYFADNYKIIIMTSDNFLPEAGLEWKELAKGVSRQVIGWDKDIMQVKVKFLKGGIGTLHSHYHSQCSYVASGSFEVEINGEKRILNAGDGFYVQPNVSHGVVCISEGTLIDTFTPAREDFL